VSDALEQAAAEREEEAFDQEVDRTLTLLLDRYVGVTADKQKMSYLRFLLKHYAASPTPWRDCYKDNLRRFGPSTKGLCGVLKDVLRQNTYWRHGAPKGPHPGHPDFGHPGMDIAYADVPGTKQWPYGNVAKLSLDDVPAEVWALLADVASQCDPCRVLLGLDPAPYPSATFLSDYVSAA